VVAEDRGAALALGVGHGPAQHLFEPLAVEDVVAQHQGARLAAHEPLADDEGLGQAVGAGLLGVGELDAEAAAVAQEPLEVGQVRRGRDDQDLADARHHEDGERVVDHGLVVDREQLLGRDLGQRVEPGAGSAGENDAFHGRQTSSLLRLNRKRASP
jgi:hypothetical protein